MTYRTIPRLKTTGLFTALTILVSIGVGCAPNRAPARTDLRWPWWPNVMEITKITRVGRPDAMGIRPIELRVLFEDPNGDPSKATGELRIRIQRPNEPEDPVDVVLDLSDPDIQNTYFERVTGCYRIPIRVDLPGLVEGRMLRLEADYRGLDGTVLKDRLDFVLDVPLQSDSESDSSRG